MSEFTFKVPKSNIVIKAKQSKKGDWSLFTINTTSFVETKLKDKLNTDQAASLSMMLVARGSSAGFFGKNTLSIVNAIKKQVKLLKKELCQKESDTLT